MSQSKKKMSLSKHETFPLREGWIEKGLYSLSKYQEKTFSKASGTAILGLGSNMVKSLKYWMSAGKVIGNSRNLVFTDFGALQMKNDSLFDTELGWLLFHYFLNTNEEEARVFFYIFNHYNQRVLDPRQIAEGFKEFYGDQFEINENSLNKDISMFFLMYGREENKNPEENTSSPLAALHLIEKNAGDKQYIFTDKSYGTGFYLIAYFVLRRLYTGRVDFDIYEAYSRPGSPARIFSLSRGEFNKYLIEMRNANLITLNKTAGLNVAYFEQEDFSLGRLYSSWYQERGIHSCIQM